MILNSSENGWDSIFMYNKRSTVADNTEEVQKVVNLIKEELANFNDSFICWPPPRD